MEKEKRSLNIKDFEIRELEDGSKVLEGYAAVFNEETDVINFKEVIKPGAFTEALKRDDLDCRALVNHNPDRVLGRKRADRQNNTLELKEDNKGLKFKINPLPDTQEAKDLIENIKLGNVDQCSFGFRVAEGGESWKENNEGINSREITKVERLFDISIVTYPAYSGTSVKVSQRALNKAKNKKNLNIKQKELELQKIRKVVL